MTMSFDDPRELVPASLSEADARDYEEKVFEVVRDAMPPGTGRSGVTATTNRPRSSITRPW